MQPTKTWKVGDRVNSNYPTNQRLRSFTGWHFEIETKESLDTEDVLRPILEVFQSKTDTIKHLKVELNLDVQLELVIHIYDGYTPGLVVGAINAVLDVDMYVFSSNELDK